MLNYNIVNEIFKTLPVGYYLGRKIECELSETESGSYYNPAKDVIVVSYPMVKKALSSVEYTREGLEELVRTILYHEISHVILTPKNWRMSRIHNIVEDERIETIFRTYYMNTNFRKTVKLINNFEGVSVISSTPISMDSAFYHLVRYRIGEEKWLERLSSLIYKYRTLNANDNYRDYQWDIDDFYRDFCREWRTKETDEARSDEGDKESGSSTEPSPDVTEMDESSETAEESEEPSEYISKTSSETAEELDDADDVEQDNSDNPGCGDESDFEDTIEDATNIIKKAIKSTIDKYNDETLTARLIQIVDRKLKQNKKTGSAINSYSGQLNKRAIATRDDYRWWTTQNREGNIRRYSNVHFNLFIDNSGSFSHNDTLMNTFIKSLDKISKMNKQFTFDVITINHEVVEWEDHNREFDSCGGNELTDDIAKVIKRHTKVNSNNYNIVLFDGDAHSDDFRNYTPEQHMAKGTAMDPFRHFDGPNTIIISDPYNKKYITASVKKARTIYTYDYCNTFADNICNLLEKVI